MWLKSFITLVATVFLLVVLTVPVGVSSAPQQTDPPVEQVRKNIQVLKGLPESQIFLVMNFVGDSLGVHCDYCHVKGEKNPQTGADNWLWEKDDKQTKLIARDQMRMVLELNRSTFKREAAVTCYSCHRGSTQVERMAPLPPRDFTKEALVTKKTVLPSTEEVLAKYRSAIGSTQKDVLAKAIVMKGTVERSTGSFPFEVISKQSNKILVRQTTPAGIRTQATNGTAGWTQTAEGTTPFTADQVRQSNILAALFSPIKIPNSVNGPSVTGLAKVDNRDAYLLTIEDTATRSIQLFFEVESGLLLRAVTITNTMLGPLNTQWDFSDYRDIGGIKLPFVIRSSDVAVFDTATRKFNEIKFDPTINDSIFEMPRSAAP